MVKSFVLEAQTVIESATLSLDTAQLVALADAAPHLQDVCEVYVMRQSGDATERPVAVVALDPVMALLSSVASLVEQAGTIRPKRKSPVRRKK